MQKNSPHRNNRFTFLRVLVVILPDFLKIKPVQDAISIDDVVVVGAYGTAQKRLDQVGSAFQVNADQLKALPALRVDKMLDAGTKEGMTQECRKTAGKKAADCRKGAQ